MNLGDLNMSHLERTVTVGRGSGQWAARGTLVHVEHRLVDPRQYRTPVLTEIVLHVDPTNTDQTIRLAFPSHTECEVGDPQTEQPVAMW
jgi:hypothetical protein